MTVKKGDSQINDKIRDDIIKKYPSITIEDTSFFYDITVFNKCEENNLLLLKPNCWSDVHPALVTIPLNETYTIPFGILYSKTPSLDALEFLKRTAMIIFINRFFYKIKSLLLPHPIYPAIKNQKLIFYKQSI